MWLVPFEGGCAAKSTAAVVAGSRATRASRKGKGPGVPRVGKREVPVHKLQQSKGDVMSSGCRGPSCHAGDGSLCMSTAPPRHHSLGELC